MREASSGETSRVRPSAISFVPLCGAGGRVVVRAARSFHDDHRARRVDQFVATSDDPWLVPAELAHRHRVTSQLGLRRLTLQREQRPGRAEQGKRPRRRGARAGRRPGRSTTSAPSHRVRTPDSSARPRSTVTGEAQILHDLTQPVDATRERFDENHREIRASEGQRYPGQPGTGSDVHRPCAVREQLRDDRTVEDVPLPDPGASRGPSSPRSTPEPTRCCRIALSQCQPVTEDRRGHRRWFHVKHHRFRRVLVRLDDVRTRFHVKQHRFRGVRTRFHVKHGIGRKGLGPRRTGARGDGVGHEIRRCARRRPGAAAPRPRSR